MRRQGCSVAHDPRTGPGVTRRLALAGAVAGAVAAAALATPALAQTGGAGAAQETPVATGVALDAPDRYRLALLKMRGQLSVARAVVRLGEPAPKHYMATAPRRTFESIAAALAERSAPLTADILGELENAAGLEPNRALRAIESAVQAINGSFAQTGPMDRDSVLGLVEGLLRAAVARYAESVEDNEVVELRAYQTGRGLVTQAEALARHSTALAGVPEQEELLKLVTLIRQAWPGIMPPPIAFAPKDVAARLDEAVAVMDEMR